MAPATASTAFPIGPIRSLGFSLYSADPTDWPILLGRAANAGATHVEVVAGMMRLISGTKLLTHRVDALQSALRASGLACTVHASHAIDLLDPRPGTLERHMSVAESCVALSHHLEASIMVLHPGFTTRARLEDPAIGPDLVARETERWFALARTGLTAGVTVAVENLPIVTQSHTGEKVSPAFDPQALARRLETVNHPALRATIDFGHAFISATDLGYDPQEAIQSLAQWAAHLHLHDDFAIPPRPGDAAGGNQQAMGTGDLHLPLGWGSIPYDNVFSQLVLPESGVTATLETALGTPYSPEETEDCLAKARALCQQLPQAQELAAE